MMKLIKVMSGAVAVLAPAIVEASILAGPVTNPANGHAYYLLAQSTWTAAEAEAVSMGGHLVTISDASENTWVCNTFLMYGGAARTLWIGLNQPSGANEPAGGWKWASGEALTFVNWVTGEPNNNTSQGPQNWAMIWPPTAASVAPYGAEKWNDTWNLANTGTGSQYLYGLHGVVEVVPTAGGGIPIAASILPAVEIAWPSETGKYYRVEWSNTLAPTVWADLSGLVPGSGATKYFYDTTRESPKRFYRVLTLP